MSPQLNGEGLNSISSFGEHDGLTPDSYQGRFAQILPPKRPTKEMQTKARMVLAAIGVTDAALRNDPTRN